MVPQAVIKSVFSFILMNHDHSDQIPKLPDKRSVNISQLHTLCILIWRFEALLFKKPETDIFVVHLGPASADHRF